MAEGLRDRVTRVVSGRIRFLFQVYVSSLNTTTFLFSEQIFHHSSAISGYLYGLGANIFEG